MKARLKFDFKVPGCYVLGGNKTLLWRETRIHPEGTYVDVQDKCPWPSSGIYGLEDGIMCHICSYESAVKTEHSSGSVEVLAIPVEFLEPADAGCQYFVFAPIATHAQRTPITVLRKRAKAHMKEFAKMRPGEEQRPVDNGRIGRRAKKQ